MPIRYGKILAALFCLLAVQCRAEDAPKPAYKTQNVVLLVIDGPRFSETWGDKTHQYVPHLANDLAKEGVIYTKFKNNGNTATNPGHAALTTGRYMDINNGGRELPTHPTVLQAWLKHSGAPQSSAWLITSKDKLEILKNSSHKDWHDKFVASSDCGRSGLGSAYRPDRDTMDAVLKILARDHPRVVVINLMEPDSCGHGADWKGYLQAIKDCDAHAWNLYQFLQKDPFYAEKTAFIISNDHGRHPDGLFDGFVSHGDDCPGCKHILCFAAGPDFNKNVVLDTPGEQIDVAVTIAELLGFKLQAAEGRVLKELFNDATGAAPKPDGP